jgi:GT2 family glycosyltransferase/glycosyltransferase involved in cell wall biosynthesis
VADHGGSNPSLNAAETLCATDLTPPSDGLPEDRPVSTWTREELIARLILLEDKLHHVESLHRAVTRSTIWRGTAGLRKLVDAHRGVRTALSGLVNRALGRTQARLSAPRPRGKPLINRIVRGAADRVLPLLRANPRLFALAQKGAAILGALDPRFPDLLKPRGALDPASAIGGLTPDLTDASRLLLIEFAWAQTARPCDFGIPSDSRALAAGFNTLTVTAAGEPATSLAVVDFRGGGNSLNHALYGFSHAEGWGSWTTGGRSAVLVWLPAGTPDAVRIQVSASAFATAFDRVSGQVWVNGTPAGEVVFDSEGTPQRFDVTVPAEHLGATTSQQNLSLSPAAKPDISIITLNYNKPAITLACVLSIVRSATRRTFEIIVLDNGSAPDRRKALSALGLPVRYIWMEVNRYFGEGNNIAAEAARAPVLCFLNNDAFLTDGALDTMADILGADSTVGAVGPVFRYPDGTIQEAGAYLNRDGTALQRGKLQPDFAVESLPEAGVVDYVSAACVMIRAEDFRALGGFDLRYDPAYYEDSDLCLRLQALGKRTVLARDATVTHVENATSADPRHKGIATDIVERHRQVFLGRWGRWLETRATADLPALAPFDGDALDGSVQSAAKARCINAVYTPFALSPGGGERYILGVAHALARRRSTAVVTPHTYSALRLNTLMRELGYPPYRSAPTTEAALLQRDVDTLVVMGNELLPTRPGSGRVRFYHCQFPFPSHTSPTSQKLHAAYLKAYAAVVVNSAFTREAYLRQIAAAGLDAPRVEIIAPPVQRITAEAGGGRKEKLIITVGRFSPLGHAKRQDVVLDAFARLARRGLLPGWRLVMAGVVPHDKEAVAFYEKVRAKAEKTPGAEIMLAPSRQHLEGLMTRARIFVSATGFGVTEMADAWKCEHFGISVAEAASAGCLPVVYAMGGPAEIVQTLGAGVTFDTASSLDAALLSALDESASDAIQAQLMDRSAVYGEEAFMAHWDALFSEFRG